VKGLFGLFSRKGNGSTTGEPDADETPTGPVPVLTDGSAPSPEHTIKANTGSMLFHTKESPYYTRTRADVWFKTPAEAEAAGFTAWNKR
jgi:hypothetical protein